MALPSSLLAEPEPFDDLPPGELTGLPPRPAPRARPAPAVRATTLAVERTLPVLPALAGLLPGGLQRGTWVGVSGVGARSLALALVAEATASGSWTVAVGDPDLGLLAAAEAGVSMERLAAVATPAPGSWGEVVGALVGAVDLVLVSPHHTVPAATVRRLGARARERGSVLVRVGDGPWPGRFDTSLSVVGGAWEGSGGGRLRSRRVEVVASGRGGRERRVPLLLPSAGGGPAAA